MRNINVFNTEDNCWVNYDVTSTQNIPRGKRFFNSEKDGTYTLDRGYGRQLYKQKGYTYRGECQNDPRPDIYTRGRFQCRREAYKYAYTEKTINTNTVEKDIYVNAKGNRTISRIRKNNNKRIIYSW